MINSFSKWGLAFLLFSLVCFSIWRNLNLLFQTDVAVGIDGYYYILQIETVLNSGSLYFSTPTPLILYFLGGIAYVTGDAVWSVKFGALFLHILLCLGLGFFLHALTKKVWVLALGVFLATSSTLHLYFLSEFISNLGALVLLVWSVFAIVRSVQTKQIFWFIISALLLICAYFSHRSAVWLILFLFTLFLIVHFWVRYADSRKRNAILGLIVSVLLFAPLFLAWQPLFTLPNWLSAELRIDPQHPFRTLGVAEYLMMLATAFTTVIVSIAKPGIVKDSLPGRAFLIVLLWSVAVALNPFLNHQAGIYALVVRLDLLIYLQLAIAIPLFFYIALPHSKPLAILLATLLIPLVVLQWKSPIPAGMASEFLQVREKLVKELPSMRAKSCAKPLIIAKHGDQFLVTKVLGVRSQKEPPSNNQYDCVLWLIHQMQGDYQLVFEGSASSSDGDFVLVEDSALRKQVETISDEDLKLLVWENPHLDALQKN